MSFLGRKTDDVILRDQLADGHWDTEDPFLFASHHHDEYPAGNAQQAPPFDQINGRNLGRDYQRFYGFSMYNGKVVPGFPLHAHWGYETVTVPTVGYVDHHDCLGNEGRFGFGDVQWLSAGSRYQHCEMYPLAFDDRPNPHTVTQIMLNLPLAAKNTPVTLQNVWAEQVPTATGDGWEASVYAGSYQGVASAAPPSRSWAADPAHHVLIVRFTLQPGAKLPFTPTAAAHRNLYLVEGAGAALDGRPVKNHSRLKVRPDAAFAFVNGDQASELWLLEGDPIGEKMSVFGPVVLGTDAEVRQALQEIRDRELSDWPWPVVNLAEPKGTPRRLRRADGSEEHPTGQRPGE